MRPASSGSSPAISRNRLVLPAPFGPVTSSASPGFKLKLKPSNRSLPPRRQAIMGGEADLVGICLELAQVDTKSQENGGAKALLAHCLAAARALI